MENPDNGRLVILVTFAQTLNSYFYQVKLFNSAALTMSGSPSSSGSNPRKFSEKIALHNQKQAEETRAFEQLMTDLTVSRVRQLATEKLTKV